MITNSVYISSESQVTPFTNELQEKRVKTWAVFNEDTMHSDITHISRRRQCSIRTGIPTDSVWCPSVIITKDKWLHKLSASIKRDEMYQYASSFLTMKSKAQWFNESVLWGTAKIEVVKWRATRISIKSHHIAFLNIINMLACPQLYFDSICFHGILAYFTWLMLSFRRQWNSSLFPILTSDRARPTESLPPEHANSPIKSEVPMHQKYI